MLDGDGTVRTWGSRFGGLIGDAGNTNGEQLIPVKLNIDNAANIVAGYTYTLAQVHDGSIYVWGRSYGGTLGPDASNSNCQIGAEVVSADGKVSLASCSP